MKRWYRVNFSVISLAFSIFFLDDVKFLVEISVAPGSLFSILFMPPPLLTPHDPVRAAQGQQQVLE